MTPITIKVSERSMRRVQIIMAAYQACQQTAAAVNQSAAGMVEQARKSVDEALGAICDAHDESLPEEYNVSLNLKDSTVTISETPVATPGQPDDSVVASNGAGHPSGLPGASPSIVEDSAP